MDVREQLIAIIADGKIHSGESLGEKLGVSRTAIWKQLKRLEELGLNLEAIKGVGYRLVTPLELLNKACIKALLSPSALAQLRDLYIHQTLDSTNHRAKELAEEDSAAGTVILAERQTAGRGRRGKSWVSPYAANIYLSLIWDFDHGAQALEGLSLAVGVGVRRALIEAGLPEVALKWPNDIYVGNAKLGGILLEMIGDPAGDCSVIIGIGINVNMPPSQSGEIDQSWTDIKTVMGDLPSRNHIVALLIEHVFTVVTGFQEQGFDIYRNEWMEADRLRNCQVKLIAGNTAVTGIALGVDQNGALQLRLSNGEVQSFVGGELSLRPDN